MGCCTSVPDDDEFTKLNEELAPDNMPPSDINYDFIFKVIVCGDPNTGKSSLVQRFEANDFRDNAGKTVGIEFGTRIVETRSGKRVKLQLWDADLQNSVPDVLNVYYQNAHGIIYVYDVTNKDSFESIPYWVEHLNQQTPKNNHVLQILIGNKIDCDNRPREIDYQTGQDVANELDIRFCECSAKTGKNIEQALLLLASDMEQHFSKFKKQ